MKTRFALAAAVLWALPAWAGEAPFSLAPLPYPPEALEPHIDRLTMEIHHGRHHRAYVDNLNAQVAAHPELAGLSLEALQGSISRFPAAVRNNGGGHYNHDLFWRLLAPTGKGGAPSKELLSAIERDFGSLEKMKALFGQAALGRFGSGWAWLIVTPTGRLAITSTPNQDNPRMDVVEERGEPILALDVWEHAYYLKYQNRRADYTAAFWNLVNWGEVSRRFAATSAPPAR
jgi:Fe-Mn family superoxide dismutase